ncbi:MAG: hypothetical protein QXZ40_00175, partial [Candidatus Micrarchaeia archaeon]
MADSTDDSNLELPPLPEEKVEEPKKHGLFFNFLIRKKEEEKPKQEPPKPEEDESIFAPPPEPAPNTKSDEKKFKCKLCDASFDKQIELKRHMKKEHPNGIKYVLVIETGDRITDLDELINAIKYMSDEMYARHIAERHQFADWVEQALGKKELAEKLRRAQNRIDAIRVLYGKNIRSEEENKSAQVASAAGKNSEWENKNEDIKSSSTETNLSEIKAPDQISPSTELKKEVKREGDGWLGFLFRKKKSSEEEKKLKLEETPPEEEPTVLEFNKEIETEKAGADVQSSTQMSASAQSSEFAKEKEEIERLSAELDNKNEEIRESVQELLKNKEYVRAKSRELSEKLKELASAQKRIDKSREMLEKKMKQLEQKAA